MVPLSQRSQSIHICLCGPDELSLVPLSSQFQAISQLFPNVQFQFPETNFTTPHQAITVTIPIDQNFTIIATAICASNISNWLDRCEKTVKIEKWYVLIDPLSHQTNELCLVYLSNTHSSLQDCGVADCNILCLSSKNSTLDFECLQNESRRLNMNWIASPSILISSKALAAPTGSSRTLILKPISTLSLLHSTLLQRVLLMGGMLGLVFTIWRWDGKWNQLPPQFQEFINLLARWTTRLRRFR